jgi:hypothetical protein
MIRSERHPPDNEPQGGSPRGPVPTSRTVVCIPACDGLSPRQSLIGGERLEARRIMEGYAYVRKSVFK